MLTSKTLNNPSNQYKIILAPNFPLPYRPGFFKKKAGNRKPRFYQTLEERFPPVLFMMYLSVKMLLMLALLLLFCGCGTGKDKYAEPSWPALRENKNLPSRKAINRALFLDSNNPEIEKTDESTAIKGHPKPPAQNREKE
ncbi:MAG: hypothetical protein ACLFUS_12930 [Candidatus Sumerlaeia bacterium]